MSEPINIDIQSKGKSLDEEIVLALLEGCADELGLCNMSGCRPVVNHLALQVVELIRNTIKEL